MKASETAIVLIEFQNDFCKEGGALYEGVKEHINANNTIKNAEDCIKKARGKCLTLLVPILFEEDYCDVGCEGVLGPIHANAALSSDEQKYVEEKFFPYIGEVLNHDEFLQRLE